MFAQSQATGYQGQSVPSKRKETEPIELDSEDEVELLDQADSDDEMALHSKSKYHDDQAELPRPAAMSQQIRSSKLSTSSCSLTSIQELRRAVKEGKHEALETIIKQHTFVGTVDVKIGLSLIQHGTKLYLVNHNLLCDELFYQLGLKSFGALGRLHLKPPSSMLELLEIAVACEPSIAEAGVTPQEIVKVRMYLQELCARLNKILDHL